ncbi:hypothetical protein [Pseudooctadecabacter jejudonensis]|uniref:Uncharacterized protein n=1 Tax=Pseudooctadecabacter jejudonensis TaxID=1391910 RepID=A0A1Y5TF21_9RHOB|nr:hypothetical protein [Pseudooctadecabacter jejudonensis]SLN62332.1 hypothetical protein PSJ8397_03311 [Pseudooctadecabacter jejudonensis]
MTTSLTQHVTISSPADVTQTKVWGRIDPDYLSAAPAFRFRRSRDVPTRANDALLDAMDDRDVDLWHKRNAILAVRDFLEELWVSEDDDALPSTVQAKAIPFIYEYVQNDGADEAVPKLMLPVAGPGGVTTKQVPQNAVVAKAEDPDAGSVYYFMLQTMGDTDLRAAELTEKLDTYEYAWKERIDIARRVFPEQSEMHSTHEFLDLSVGAIVERFPFLKNQHKAITDVRNTLQKRLVDEQDYGLVQALFKEVQDLNHDLAAIERAISGLVGFASSRGFVLVTEDNQPLVGTKQGAAHTYTDFKAGDLVKTRRYISRWVEEKIVHRSRRTWYGKRKRWTETHRIQRSSKDIDFKAVDSTDSMLSDYIAETLKGLNAIVLQNADDGLEATDGRSLASIMAQCELDEAYQRNCVLLMPVYNQSLFGEDIIAGYHVIERPNRGRRIVSLPDFFFEEQISYKLRWLGLELGELVSSINLLPGEVRDISLQTKRSSLRETDFKSTQTYESDATTSLDTVTSIENEFQRENTSEKTKSWSVKASGSYGGFSAGASSSGTSKQTARQFAKSLNKLTTQAISKLRKKARSEVVARELSREEVEATSRSSGHISNPNVGRTLNVNFFTINNVFAASTYMDDIGFTYISPFELIDGTDIREVRSYAKEDLPEFLDTVLEDMTRLLMMGQRFSNAGLGRAERHARALADAKTYVDAVKQDFLAAFQDYALEDRPTDDAALVAEKEPVSAFAIQGDGDDPRAMNLAQDNDLGRLLSKLVATGRAIEPDIVLSPSGAVYADSYTGQTEGLESYAVEMRKLEVEKQFGAVLKEMSTKTALASGTRDAHYNVAHQKVSDTELRVQIGGTIKDGTWRYSIGGHLIGSLEVAGGLRTFTLALDPDRHDNLPIDQLPGHLVRHD